MGIHVQRQRWRCKACSKTFWQPLPEVHQKHTMTLRLVAHIEKQSLPRTFVEVADEVGVTEATIRNIFKAYVQRMEAETTFHLTHHSVSAIIHTRIQALTLKEEHMRDAAYDAGTTRLFQTTDWSYVWLMPDHEIISLLETAPTCQREVCEQWVAKSVAAHRGLPKHYHNQNATDYDGMYDD